MRNDGDWSTGQITWPQLLRSLPHAAFGRRCGKLRNVDVDIQSHTYGKFTHFTHSSTAPFQFTNSRARLQNCTFSQACICCSGCQIWLQTSCIAASEDDLQVYAQEDSLQQYIRTIIDHRPPHPRTLTSPPKWLKQQYTMVALKPAYLQSCPCRPWHSLRFRLACIFASFTSSLHAKYIHCINST